MYLHNKWKNEKWDAFKSFGDKIRSRQRVYKQHYSSLSFFTASYKRIPLIYSLKMDASLFFYKMRAGLNCFIGFILFSLKAAVVGYWYSVRAVWMSNMREWCGFTITFIIWTLFVYVCKCLCAVRLVYCLKSRTPDSVQLMYSFAANQTVFSL